MSESRLGSRMAAGALIGSGRKRRSFRLGGRWMIQLVQIECILCITIVRI
ncbi:hypothetical protein KP806_25745 [Paenibacillus sp. N4]|nr:hypothetical protein [Paenibacillus vietnamensis]MCA0758464.1 hypothetical protein [Paenibacillus vietnamensis]